MGKLRLAILLALPLSVAAPLHAADDARAVIQRAIEAHGGKAPLTDHKAEIVQTEGTVTLQGFTATFTTVTTVQLPDQFKNVMRCSILGMETSAVQVLNGDQAWMTVNGEMKPIPEALRAEMEHTKYAEQVTRLVPLIEDKAYQLSLLSEIKVQGVVLVGVRVQSKGHGDIDLYFDQKSGLLAKTKRASLDGSLQPVSQEVYWNNYEMKDGINRPMKYVSYQGGKKISTGKITDVRYPEKIDAKEFAKPE